MVHQDRVPGHNKATYGPVPQADQAFIVEFLEVAPMPILADRVFSIYLRGYLCASRRKELGLLDNALIKAIIHVTGSAVLPDGRLEEPKKITLPLRTMALSSSAHVAIRDFQGAHVDHVPSTGTADILLDFRIPSMFMRSGTWTFAVDARLDDKTETCLFAMSLTHWMEGGLNA